MQSVKDHGRFRKGEPTKIIFRDESDMENTSHGLQHYLDQIKAETPQIHSLIKELSKVTGTLLVNWYRFCLLEGVDPDAGYAKSLLDLSNRVSNCNEVLLSELKNKGKEEAVKESSMYLDFIMVPQLTRRYKHEEFL